VFVAARELVEHRLREQRFAPERDETGGIEMLRMKGPETHAYLTISQTPVTVSANPIARGTSKPRCTAPKNPN
jgi:hypothetical protein